MGAFHEGGVENAFRYWKKLPNAIESRRRVNCETTDRCHQELTLNNDSVKAIPSSMMDVSSQSCVPS